MRFNVLIPAKGVRVFSWLRRGFQCFVCSDVGLRWAVAGSQLATGYSNIFSISEQRSKQLCQRDALMALGKSS